MHSVLWNLLWISFCLAAVLLPVVESFEIEYRDVQGVLHARTLGGCADYLPHIRIDHGRRIDMEERIYWQWR